MNANGRSAPSPASGQFNLGRAAAVPSVPLALVVTAAGLPPGRLTATFAPPQTNGGSEIIR